MLELPQAQRPFRALQWRGDPSYTLKLDIFGGQNPSMSSRYPFRSPSAAKASASPS